jgi:hypothetical protein
MALTVFIDEFEFVLAKMEVSGCGRMRVQDSDTLQSRAAPLDAPAIEGQPISALRWIIATNSHKRPIWSPNPIQRRASTTYCR